MNEKCKPWMKQTGSAYMYINQTLMQAHILVIMLWAGKGLAVKGQRDSCKLRHVSLLKKSAFQWLEQATLTFKELEQAMVQSPVLAFANVEEEGFIIRQCFSGYEHIDKFLTVTQNIKQNGVPHDFLRLCLFPYSLTHHATAWFDRLSKNSIHSWEEMVTEFLSKYVPPLMVTKLRNDISNFRQLPDESLFDAWERYKLSIDRCPNHNMLPVTQLNTFYTGLTLRHRDTINAVAGAQKGESSRSITSSSPEIEALTH
ncbi:reverse transcriptase domain-containing protein [Tanacetum coccineum]